MTGKRARRKAAPDETTPDAAAAQTAQTTEATADDQAAPPDPAAGPPPDGPAPPVELEDAAGGPDEAGDRFGVYDPVRLRFLGGVYGTRADARKAAAAMGVRSPEIRPL